MRKLIVIILQLPIRLYKLLISPLLPKSCIYHPTCSTYFLDSLKVHGPLKGSVLGILRILRCNPFFMGGFDPVSKDAKLKTEIRKFRIFRRKD